MLDIIHTANLFESMCIYGKYFDMSNNVRPPRQRKRLVQACCKPKNECVEEVIKKKKRYKYQITKIANKADAMSPKSTIIAQPGPSIIIVQPSNSTKFFCESINSTLPPKKRKLNNFCQNFQEVEKPAVIKSETNLTTCTKHRADLEIPLNLSVSDPKQTNCVSSSSDTVADLNTVPTMPPLGQLGYAAWQLYNLALIPDEDGDFPIHIATAQDNVQAVRKLIQTMQQMKSRVDVFNKLRQTPLHLAMIIGCAESAKLLIESGASPLAVTRQGDTAIHLAVMYGHLDCLKILIENYKGKLDLNLRNHEGLTPLHLAVQKREKLILEYLCENGADKNVLDGKSGRTPLFHAAENNEIEIVELLIRHKADVNIPNYSGNDPLSTANGRGFLKMVKLLLANNAEESVEVLKEIKT